MAKLSFFDTTSRLPMYTAALLLTVGQISAQKSAKPSTPGASVPQAIMLQIVKAEDERRWDDGLRRLMNDKNPAVRQRATLAAGRIGDERAIPFLIERLEQDNAVNVRSMSAFSLGEVESGTASAALLTVLNTTNAAGLLRSRAIEALGKIAAALPSDQEERKRELGAAILEALQLEAARHSATDQLTVLLGLTAVLRARPINAGSVVSGFLSNADPRVRADAANVLARLRLKDGAEKLRELLMKDPDAVVRANAARALGAAEDKPAFDALLDRAVNDPDSRVRISAIRALATLKNSRAALPLLEHSRNIAQQDLRTRPTQANEILEIATTLGRVLQATGNEEALYLLRETAERVNHHAPEVEIAFARVSPRQYLAVFGNSQTAKRTAQEILMLDWRAGSGIAQGLGEIASLPETTKERAMLVEAAENISLGMLDYRKAGININTLVAVHSEYAIPEVLRALAAFKPKDLGAILRNQLKESDVIVRATGAELLGELPPDEINARALAQAFPPALNDQMNDAALAILDSLAKQKTAFANDTIKSGLDSNDHLVRRKAVALLKANSAGDFASRIGTVKTQNTAADYQRAVARTGKTARATVATSKGSFVIELLPDDAPLNVDNFIQLAKRGYFQGITFHRVVPNFVIQGGDPRGEGSGGPGYQIRCEINEVPYGRGAVGMALSGKDTGGSQWFVTHSPQPHLDGGYTVFGRVVAGMDVVDRIVRGDIIQSVTVVERARL